MIPYFQRLARVQNVLNTIQKLDMLDEILEAHGDVTPEGLALLKRVFKGWK